MLLYIKAEQIEILLGDPTRTRTKTRTRTRMRRRNLLFSDSSESEGESNKIKTNIMKKNQKNALSSLSSYKKSKCKIKNPRKIKIIFKINMILIQNDKKEVEIKSNICSSSSFTTEHNTTNQMSIVNFQKGMTKCPFLLYINLSMIVFILFLFLLSKYAKKGHLHLVVSCCIVFFCASWSITLICVSDNNDY